MGKATRSTRNKGSCSHDQRPTGADEELEGQPGDGSPCPGRLYGSRSRSCPSGQPGMVPRDWRWPAHERRDRGGMEAKLMGYRTSHSRKLFGKCVRCGIERRMHRDHIVPRFLGGTDEPGNIQLLCANCHEDKTAQDLLGRKFPGRRISHETRSRMSASHRGKEISSETRAKISAARVGYKHTPETRAKMGAAHRGHRLSPSHVAKISAALKAYYARRRVEEWA